MTTELVVALTTHLLEDSQPIGAKLWSQLRTATNTDIRAWAEQMLPKDDVGRITDCLARVSEVEEALEKLREIGIIAITEFDSRYPERLRASLHHARPPVLFVAGNDRLLQTDCIGVVGSRDVDESGAEFAEAVGRTIADEGLTLVSGGAKGVDSIATRAAHLAGGNSIAFVADSLAKLVNAANEAEAIESGRACFASSFSPYASFSVASRMARNKLIYGISIATVVVSSGVDTGGTWAGATEALKKRLCPVLVRQTHDAPPGNAALIARGGISITKPCQLLEAIHSTPPGTLPL